MATGTPRRRGLLEELALDDEIRDPTVVGPRAGADLMQAAAELGLEGVIAKRLDSPYQPGAPSRYWIKAPLNKTGEVVIAGWKSNAALG